MRFLPFVILAFMTALDGTYFPLINEEESGSGASDVYVSEDTVLDKLFNVSRNLDLGRDSLYGADIFTLSETDIQDFTGDAVMRYINPLDGEIFRMSLRPYHEIEGTFGVDKIIAAWEDDLFQDILNSFPAHLYFQWLPDYETEDDRRFVDNYPTMEAARPGKNYYIPLTNYHGHSILNVCLWVCSEASYQTYHARAEEDRRLRMDDPEGAGGIVFGPRTLRRSDAQADLNADDGGDRPRGRFWTEDDDAASSSFEGSLPEDDDDVEAGYESASSLDALPTLPPIAEVDSERTVTPPFPRDEVPTGPCTCGTELPCPFATEPHYHDCGVTRAPGFFGIEAESDSGFDASPIVTPTPISPFTGGINWEQAFEASEREGESVNDVWWGGSVAEW